MSKMLIGTELDYQLIILKAKREVFDEIRKHFKLRPNVDLESNINMGINEFNEIEKRHLSTLPSAKRHNISSKKDCSNCDDGSDGVPDCVIDGECPDNIKSSPS